MIMISKIIINAMLSFAKHYKAVKIFPKGKGREGKVLFRKVFPNV